MPTPNETANVFAINAQSAWLDTYFFLASATGLTISGLFLDPQGHTCIDQVTGIPMVGLTATTVNIAAGTPLGFFGLTGSGSSGAFTTLPLRYPKAAGFSGTVFNSTLAPIMLYFETNPLLAYSTDFTNHPSRYNSVIIPNQSGGLGTPFNVGAIA